ncbi:MAG: cytochrome c biogenesis protein CcsA, partial [Bacteroidota bacterium]
MTDLGYWVTAAALVCSAVSTLLYAGAVRTRALVRRPRVFLALGAGAVAAASVLLVVLILSHDFSNGYVFSHSSRSLPLHYLLSSFYAGQEGSFLFWALASAAISLVLLGNARRRGVEAPVMAVYAAAQTLLLLLLVVKSPFRSVWEMFPDAIPSQVPADGWGLNPLLQNFWMVIHPPVLFVGFASMAVPFSFALAGLWKRDTSLLAAKGFSWVLLATLVLGIGIMLGAYWAYGVLGWGGYWGWDPVENSSLVPWLTGIAMLHTMAAQRKTGGFAWTNHLLATASFFLVIYSTFLTRSGILGKASQHAFADPSAGVYGLLLVYLLLIAGAGAWLMILRRKDLSAAAIGTHLVSRESVLGAGGLALVLIAVVVLAGTSLPIFSESAVEPAFYDATTLPLAVALGLLIGLSLLTQWGAQPAAGVLRR